MGLIEWILRTWWNLSYYEEQGEEMGSEDLWQIINKSTAFRIYMQSVLESENMLFMKLVYKIKNY